MTPEPGPEAFVLPARVHIETAPGETVMAAANRAGYYWPTICKGNGLCARCVMTVKDGAENLSEMGREERETLDRVRGPGASTTERLACQATICGPVTVQRRGVKPIVEHE